MSYAWDPTAVERSILGQIRRDQSLDRYNALFGFTYFSDYSKFPDWSGVTYQGRPTHAAGAYQDEPGTWDEIVTATGLTDFSPVSQDIGNLWLLRTFGQASQWATNFSDDGGHYVFAADALPPPAPEPTITGTVTDISGAQWTFSTLLTKATTHMVAATVGLAAGGYVALQQPAPAVPEPRPMPIVMPVSPPQAKMERLTEWETCCRAMIAATAGAYHC